MTVWPRRYGFNKNSARRNRPLLPCNRDERTVLRRPEVARTVSFMVAALRHSHTNHHPTINNQFICKTTRPHMQARRVPFQPIMLKSTASPNPNVITTDTAETTIKTDCKPIVPSSGSAPQPKHVHALLKGLLCIYDSQYQRSFIASEGLKSVSLLMASTRTFIRKMQTHKHRHQVPRDGCPGCAGLQALKTVVSMQLTEAALSQHTERHDALERILAQLDASNPVPLQPLNHLKHNHCPLPAVDDAPIGVNEEA